MATKQTESAGLDLGAIKSNTVECEWMDVLHPTTRKPTGARIKLYSAESEHYKDAQNKAINRRMRQRRGGGQLTAEEAEQEALGMLKKATVDWENIQLDGENLSCTEANIHRVYSEFPWLREQVEEFINQRDNFIKS